MELEPCKFCGGHPWYESDPKYDEDNVCDIYTFLECSTCRAHTESFSKSEEAERAWQNKEYEVSERNAL